MIFRNPVTNALADIRDGKHNNEACKHNCTENGTIFNHPPYPCSFRKKGIRKRFYNWLKGDTEIKNMIQYKKIEVETLPPQVWTQDDAKAIKVADFDFKSALTKERESELALGLRTNDDIKELVDHLEKL